MAIQILSNEATGSSMPRIAGVWEKDHGRFRRHILSSRNRDLQLHHMVSTASDLPPLAMKMRLFSFFDPNAFCTRITSLCPFKFVESASNVSGTGLKKTICSAPAFL
jgi:hypothetical protein